MKVITEVTARVDGFAHGGFFTVRRCVCGAAAGLNIGKDDAEDPRVMPCCGRKLFYRQEAPKVFEVAE